MKKMIVCAAIALMTAVGLAEQYQVFDIAFNVNTTDGKGVVTSCDGEYCYRERRTVTIQGVLGGCGCGAILANGTCANAILYLWDATHKIAITNVESTTGWQLQRVGKSKTVLEHFVTLKATYGENDQYSFDIVMSGFGTYQQNKKDATASRAGTITGYFAGYAAAPWYVKPGSCSACHVEPATVKETEATILCEECGQSEISDFTPFCGQYKVKYNAGKSANVSKKGLNAKYLNLPSYVGITDYVATNIGLDVD